ncbi:hypothetical protein CDD82_3634 [Ophiocordyceps australis]|uniref:Stress response RCI peptide n=1 Tax=Ophiocordyceps australis TaxID=1399860 RepID=A0A2C5Z836_9HYPO|nr:hypothetical protein CDD82_3634 [Ophiocordyceps australis]
MCSADIFLGVIAILFPPLPVWVKRGICSADSIINILLCVLGILPGLIHSWYIIAKYPDDPYEYETLGPEAGGRLVWVQVAAPPGSGCRHCSHPCNGTSHHQQRSSQQKKHKHSRQQPQPRQQQPESHPAMNYGTQGASSASAGASNSQAVPPSYAEVVAGDHKIQTAD